MMISLTEGFLRWSFCVLSLLHVSTASFLSDPFVKWSYRLPESGEIGRRGLRRGNAVVVSTYGALVFASADDGSLHILSPDLDFTALYEPTEVPGTFTECRSGVSLIETEDEVVAIYAVVDVPITASVSFDGVLNDVATVSEVASRVIAVNVNGAQLWSVNLPGVVSGTPIVGKDGKTIYVCVNQRSTEGNEHNSPAGRVAVILENKGNPFVTAEMFPSDRSGPFGPLGVHPIRVHGADGDLVFFAESREDGFAEDGRLYFITPSSKHAQNSGIGADSYDFNTFSDLGLSSIIRPTMSSDGVNLWTGGTGSIVVGWSGVTDMIEDMENNFPVKTSWRTSVSPNERNQSQPLMNALVASEDKQYLFINTLTNKLVCIDAQSGESVWSEDESESTYFSEPKLSSFGGSSMLYTIELLNGRVRQHDALNGNRLWEFDCTSVSEVSSCQDSVEAEFAVSPTGNELYYGDIFGNIVALQVAEFVPTPSPTLFQTPKPTAGISEPPTKLTDGPTVSVDTSSSINRPVPTSSSSSTNDTLLVSLVVVVSLLAVVTVGLLFLRQYRRKKIKASARDREEEADRRWKQKQMAWEEACREAEQITISEIKQECHVPKAEPPIRKSSRSKSSYLSRVPTRLESIEEVDDEMSVNTDFSRSQGVAPPLQLGHRDPSKRLAPTMEVSNVCSPDTTINVQSAPSLPVEEVYEEEQEPFRNFTDGNLRIPEADSRQSYFAARSSGDGIDDGMDYRNRPFDESEGEYENEEAGGIISVFGDEILESTSFEDDDEFNARRYAKGGQAAQQAMPYHSGGRMPPPIS